MTKITAKQAAFAEKWFETGDGLTAHRHAYPDQKSSDKSRREAASGLLNHPNVVQRIAELRKPAADMLTMDAAQVLHRWVNIATADPRELVDTIRCNCRHCWGIGGKYQWRQEGEFYEALAEAARVNEMAKKGAEKPLPDDEGGYGFKGTRAPNPDCPKCDGTGQALTLVKDSRTLSPGAVMLLAGYKQGKDGIEVKMHDQAAILRDIAKYLGMLVDTKRLEGAVGIAQTQVTPEVAAAIAAKLASQI